MPSRPALKAAGCGSKAVVRQGHTSTRAAAGSSKTSGKPTSDVLLSKAQSRADPVVSPGTWPNSFEPVVFDSRYIGRYRDPSQHDSAPHSSTLPVSRRGRASWFAPSTVNSIVGKLPREDKQAAASDQPAQHTTSSSYPKASTSRNIDETRGRVRNARKEMEKAWAANESYPTDNSSSSSGSRHKPSPLTALLMPGSGSQYVGMASFLENYKAARETWEEAEEALAQFEKWRKDLKLHELPELKHLNLLDWPVWQKERSKKELRQIVQNGPQDELTRSSNSQPAICITSIALLRTLERDFGIPISQRADYFAGHSSGEYSACVASGAITFTEGVHLTRLHGLLTSRALQLSSLKTYSDHEARDEQRAQMSAIVLQGDATAKQVRKVIKKIREENEGNQGMVEVASYNSSRQLILSGSRAGVLRACEILGEKDLAARAADLPVFAPFHCSFMEPAARGMTHAWNNGVKAKAPRAPIVSNLDAELVTDPERLKRDIVASIHKPVQWASALDVMREKGVSRYVFVGPGKALANLAKKENKSGTWKGWKELQIATVATPDDMEDTAELCQDLCREEAARANSGEALSASA